MYVYCVVRTCVHEAHHGVDIDHGWMWERCGECKGLEKTCEEEEELMLCQLLPDTISLAYKEWNASVVLPEVSFIINESVRIELVWIVPVLGVVHDGGDVCKDLSSLGESEAVEGDFLCCSVRCGEDDTGMTENLMYDCISVRHHLSVSKLGSTTSYHCVNLLLYTLLYTGISSQVIEGEDEDGGCCLRTGSEDIHECSLHVSFSNIGMEG